MKRVRLIPDEPPLAPRQLTQLISYPWPFLMTSDGGQLIKNVQAPVVAPKKGSRAQELPRRTVKKA